MTVKQSTVGRYCVLAVSGDVRGGEVDYLALRHESYQALAESPYLAINLLHTTFIDSQTLGLLVELLRSAQGRGGEMVLVAVNERASRWFALSGLDRLFKILPEEAALKVASKLAEPAAERKPALDRVNIDLMVAELQAALGEADDAGAPSAAGPVDDKVLTEIEKLLGNP